VSDKFDDFLNRLEMPLSEPVIVTMADKAVGAQVACVRCAGVLIQHTIRSAWGERPITAPWFNQGRVSHDSGLG
jgi:hypothetical protein